MPHARDAYDLDPNPIDGGQAFVYFGTRRSDGLRIALKQRKYQTFEAKARMRREVDVQRSLIHQNIMPVLDWDASDYEWYVMPRGDRVLSDLATPLADQDLLAIARAVLAALDTAHVAGNPHRDVKPQNIVEIDYGGPVRWVLADWGMTRRPHGQTTNHLTVTGHLVGTEGYAPPESYRDAHAVGPRGDLYSLGQVIGWATTGTHPIPNVPPSAPEPWRRVVRSLTQLQPEQRPASAQEVLGLLERLSVSRTGSMSALTNALDLADNGDADAGVTACLEAVPFVGDHDLMLDRIAKLRGVAGRLVAEHPDDVRILVKGMIEAFDSFGSRNFDYANTPLHWLFEILRECAHRDLDLLEDLVGPVFSVEAGWNRFAQRDRTVAWLNRLRGDAAQIVADQLRVDADMRRYLGGRVGNASSPGIVAAMREGNDGGT